VVGWVFMHRCHELKIVTGKTPFGSKGWLERTRQISDTIGGFFYKTNDPLFTSLPIEERFLVKNSYFNVDRLKDEIVALMNDFPEDRRTIISYMLTTLLKKVSSKKDGYALVSKEKPKKAMLLIDLALFLYAFCPAFDQTRKVISIIVYLNGDIDFKEESGASYNLQNKFRLYSFIFSQGNIFDLRDWFPFFSEYGISLDSKTENALIEKAKLANDPIIWANILVYSKYYQNFSNMIRTQVESVIQAQISKVTEKSPMLQREFWFVLIFHNCPDISGRIRDDMSSIVNKISASASSDNPSDKATKLVCDFIQTQSSNGNKPKTSFFDWRNAQSIGEQITFRTYQRTIFKGYRKNRNSLYASLD